MPRNGTKRNASPSIQSEKGTHSRLFFFILTIFSFRDFFSNINVIKQCMTSAGDCLYFGAGR